MIFYFVFCVVFKNDIRIAVGRLVNDLAIFYFVFCVVFKNGIRIGVGGLVNDLTIFYFQLCLRNHPFQKHPKTVSWLKYPLAPWGHLKWDSLGFFCNISGDFGDFVRKCRGIFWRQFIFRGIFQFSIVHTSEKYPGIQANNNFAYNSP